MADAYLAMIASFKDGSILGEPIGTRMLPGMAVIASVAQADRFIRNYVVAVEKAQIKTPCEAFANVVKENVQFACSYWFDGHPCADFMLEALRRIEDRHA